MVDNNQREQDPQRQDSRGDVVMKLFSVCKGTHVHKLRLPWDSVHSPSNRNDLAGTALPRCSTQNLRRSNQCYTMQERQQCSSSALRHACLHSILSTAASAAHG